MHDAKSARDLFNSGSLKGHHWVPFDSLNGLDISEDTMRYWGAAKSGATVAGDHLYDAAHIAYNGAVRAELAGYVEQHGISLATMTTDQARGFTNHLLSGSTNSTIRGYVTHISSSVAARAAAAIGSCQLGRASLGLVRAVGSVGATLLFHSGNLQ